MQIKKALQAIKEAERPIICCGGGVVLAGAREGNDRVCPDNSGIPVAATMMGIGVMPMDSPYYLGMIGSHGRTSANKAMQRGGP